MYISFLLCYNKYMEQRKRYPWRQRCQVFEERAEEYDNWFENSLIFDIELAALRSVTPDPLRPWVEIGIGPGRFAVGLGTDIGIDPATAALHFAARRGIATIAGIAEELPLADASMGTVSMLFTLCFLASPKDALTECHRILRPEGMLLIGFIPARSAWGDMLARKKKARHPYYRHVRCKTAAETISLLHRAGFSVVKGCSTLFQPPDQVTRFEEPRSEPDEMAGFCVVTATKRNSN